MSDIMVLMVASAVLIAIKDTRDIEDIMDIVDIRAIMVIVDIKVIMVIMDIKVIMGSLFIMAIELISIIIIDIMDKHMDSKLVIMDSKLKLVVIRVFIKGEAIDKWIL